jgi:filamentous hemagglutinin
MKTLLRLLGLGIVASVAALVLLATGSLPNLTVGLSQTHGPIAIKSAIPAGENLAAFSNAFSGFGQFYAEQFSALASLGQSSVPASANQVRLAANAWSNFGIFYSQQISSLLPASGAALAKEAQQIKTAVLWQRQQADQALASLGQALIGKTTAEYLAEQPVRKPQLAFRPIHPRGLATSSQSFNPSRAPGQQPQVLGLSTTRQAASQGQSSPAMSATQIGALVAQAVQEYLSTSSLTGPPGPAGPAGPPGAPGNSGIVQNAGGQTTAVIGGNPIVTYVPPVPTSDFSGETLAGFTQLSAGSFSSGNTDINGNLNVTGPIAASSLSTSGSAVITGALTAATSTLSSLSVSGPVSLTGSTTIAGLTVSGLNPGLTLGSVAFQGAAGLSQDNSSFFYDATDHRLGLGTTTPSQLLSVAGNALVTGNEAISGTLTVAGLSTLATSTATNLTIAQAPTISAFSTGVIHSSSLGLLSSSLVANADLINPYIGITAGTGLSGGGSAALGATTTLAIAATGTPGSYGSASQVPVITTNAYGEVISVSNTPIAIDASALTTGILPIVRGGLGTTTLGSLSVGSNLSISGGQSVLIGTSTQISLGPNVVTSVSSGTNVTGSIASSVLTLSWQGQLSVPNGGTGDSSLTASDILFGNGSSAIATSSAFTFATGTGLTVSATSTLATTTIAQLSVTGNVGIGTTSPGQLLSVAGNMQLTGTLFDGTNASGTLGMLLESTGARTQWVATSTLGLGGGASLSGGTPGYSTIWTSPTAVGVGAVIDNGSVAGINATSSTVTFNLQGSAGISAILNVASSSGASDLYVAGSGNVGIGTKTPNSLLTVAGNTLLAGNATTTGNLVVLGSLLASANTAPIVVSKGGPISIGTGASITITAPTSITNGNLLVAVISNKGVSSETWTPPSGFSQIGSTITNTGGSKEVTGIFCKVASSESGNYTFSFNNSVPSLGVGVMLNISGASSCTPDVSTTTNADASTLSLGSVTPGNSNDLLVVVAASGQGGNNGAALSVSEPGNFVKQSSSNSQITYTLPWGAGATTPVSLSSYNSSGANSDAFVGALIAFSPSASATAIFAANGGPASLNSLNVANGVDIQGQLQPSDLVIPNCGGTCTSGGASGTISSDTNSNHRTDPDSHSGADSRPGNHTGSR